jgi:hypothetical protein
LTLKNRDGRAVTPFKSRTVTVVFGEPVRETSAASALNTLFVPVYVAVSLQVMKSVEACTW